MHYLRHSWFDPTSLMSRSVQWDILSGDASTNAALIQEYKAALLAENDANGVILPKRRGRQRQVDNIPMRVYPEQLAKTIGVFGNEQTIHALYSVKMSNRPAALVGIRVEKTDSKITAHLDMVYVLKMWRRRGLGQAIAEHAGRWAALGMNSWSNDSVKREFICSATTGSPVEASLATIFFRSCIETANLHAIQIPTQQWFIGAPKEA